MKKFFAEVIFWSHVAIVGFWYALFLVPSSWWPGKIEFHFFFTIAIVAHQFLWGLVIMPWTKRYRMVCILTTPMQFLRGQSISDSKNYDHSWTAELIGRSGVTVPHWFATLLTFGILTAVTIQYFFFR
ncbi:MAG: hypothetical protein Q8Q38_01045 [bacterium]|nr:hypothetical protein [bacterium]